jgi:glycosyltransferase involved in cell wall biosynthesis
MKIVYVIQYFGSPDNSFASGRSWDFAHEWAKRGHKVWIICSDAYFIDKIALPDFSKTPNISISVIHQNYTNSFSIWKRLTAFLGFSFKTLRLLLENPSNYEIAYISSTPLTTGLVGYLQKIMTKKKWIFEVRDLWPDFPIQALGLQQSFLSKLLYWFENLFYKSSDQIICLSPKAHQILLFQKKLPKNKIHLIPNGFSSIDYLKKSENFKPSPFKTYLYEGALGKANNIPWLISFFDSILKNDSRAKVIIAGFGIYENDILEWKNSHSQANRIDFRGRLSRNEIHKILPHVSYCLVTFSNWEILESNSPNKLFDAIGYGIPVITNTKGWIADLAEKSGGYYELDPITASKIACHKSLKINLDLSVLHSEFNRSKLASNVIDIMHNCG